MGSIQSRRLGARLILMSTAALALALPAHAATAGAVSIAEGPLESALVALAAQTHEQLLYPPELVRGRRAPALAGRYTAEEALQRLVGRGDIAVTRAGPNVLVLKRRAANVSSTSAADPGAAADRPFGGENRLARAPSPAGPDGAPPRAEAAPPAQTTPTPSTVAEVLVTGSNIRGARTPSPLMVLDRADIDRSGQTTVADALNVLPQNFSGVATEGTSNTGADRVGRSVTFSSGVNLRGLGPAATLVMINGRRLAGAGSFGDFADISTLPTGAVQRVELLLDGASAVYGSDAVGGVVNIVLRKAFEGAETRFTVGAATRGEPYEAQLSQTFGRRWEGGGVLFSYELRRRERLSGDDRDFAANADLRPLGGHDQRLTSSHPGNLLTTVGGVSVVGWAIPEGQTGVGLRPQDFLPGQVNLENQRRGVDILPRQTLNAVYLAADQAFGDRLEVSADARYGYRRYDARLSASTANIAVTRANPFYVAPNGAATETIAYSFGDEIGNARQTGGQESLSATLGGKLRLFGDWRADGYLAFAQEIAEVWNANLVNSALLQEAVGSVADRPQTAFSTAANGFFNPFGGTLGVNSPGILAFIASGASSNRTRDRVASANLQADGTVLALPGGPLKLALGGQVRRETLLRFGSSYTSSVAFTPQQGADVARDVAAAFAEVQVPIFGPDNARPGLRRLELSLAGRVERYSDVGTTTNPKVGLLWEPAEGVRLRGTYGTSFRAPALRETHDAEIYSGTLLPLGATRIRTLLLSGGNPDLKPETATTWTLGADLAPAAVPALRLSATWFDVRFEDRIGKPVQDNILNALSDPNLASFIAFISPATNAQDRTRIEALLAAPATNAASAAFGPDAYGAIGDNRFVNTAGLHVSGIDVSAAYAVDLGSDRLALAANGAWMTTYAQQVTPTARVVDLVGVANFPVTFRGRATADWTRGRVTVGGALNYVAGYKDALGQEISSQGTADLQLRLAPAEHGPWRGVAAMLNVRNVFDRDPPFYDNIAGVAYDPANADPIGRYVSLQLTRAW